MSKKARFLTLVIVITLIASMLCLPAHAQAKIPKNGYYEEISRCHAFYCPKCGQFIAYIDWTYTNQYLDDHVVHSQYSYNINGLRCRNPNCNWRGGFDPDCGEIVKY